MQAHFLGLVSRTRVGEGCLEVCHEIRTTASCCPLYTPQVQDSTFESPLWAPLLLIGKLRRESISPGLCRAETLQDEMQELESEGLCKYVALVSFIRQGSCLLLMRGSDLNWVDCERNLSGKGQLRLCHDVTYLAQDLPHTMLRCFHCHSQAEGWCLFIEFLNRGMKGLSCSLSWWLATIHLISEIFSFLGRRNLKPFHRRRQYTGS